jgi:hypothetical protein
MRRDGNFDLIGDAFEVDIYGSSKGAVRMAVLWDDLLAAGRIAAAARTHE